MLRFDGTEIQLAEAGEEDEESFLHETMIHEVLLSDQEVAEQTDKEKDLYEKIKIHANLAMRSILQKNCHLVAAYQRVLFPSFMH